MLGKVFSTKAWLIIAGLIHLVMGVILQTFQSGMVAEMGWGDAVGSHDAITATRSCARVGAGIVIDTISIIAFFASIQPLIAATTIGRRGSAAASQAYAEGSK